VIVIVVSTGFLKIRRLVRQLVGIVPMAHLAANPHVAAIDDPAIILKLRGYGCDALAWR